MKKRRYILELVILFVLLTLFGCDEGYKLRSVGSLDTSTSIFLDDDEEEKNLRDIELEEGIKLEIDTQSEADTKNKTDVKLEADTKNKTNVKLEADTKNEADVKLEAAAENKTDIKQKVDSEDTASSGIVEDGVYTTPELVSAYLNVYHKLPKNYITKKEAQKLGWDNKEGNLWTVTDQKSIGGDRFGNREGLLPMEEGRQWYECDVNYDGGYRGGERILYSDDGLIYYTDDHYETFSQLY